jgi:hypothetical protein
VWAEVYSALAAAGFAGEYDGLLAVEELRNKRGTQGEGARGDGRWGWRAEGAPVLGYGPFARVR